MFRPPILQTPTFKLILGLGLCTVGGAMLYAYFRMQDDDDNNEKNEKEKSLQKNDGKKKVLKEVTMTFKVKMEHIALLIGRDGQNIARIEEKTNTKINFRDKDSSFKFCDIDGYPNDVKIARDIILKDIERCSIVEEDIYVPTFVCNKIMGRGGEGIQEISRKSLAKISVDPSSTLTSDKKRLLITGNTHQCIIARKLIEDKIKEEDDLRKAVEESELTREPRRSPTNSVTSSLYSSQTSLSSHLAPKDKIMSYSNENKTMEIYVSAVATPAKFWIQLIGPQTKKLDSLVKEMTEYYNDEENRKMHKIKEPYLGQIVATIYCYDNKWYRAEVVDILPNEAKDGGVTLDLYFVDYGDSEYISTNDIYELRTDFLTLRFQAVECFLANIKPTSQENPNLWSETAIQRFEELTDVACWKKLVARVVTYKNKPRSTQGPNREGTAIPGIELFDIVEGSELNVANYLISCGLALPTEGSMLESVMKSNSNTPTNSPTQSAPHSPTQSPNQSPTQSPIQSPPPDSSSNSCLSPFPNVTSESENHNDIHISAEDALFQSQIEHLDKKNYNANNSSKEVNPELFTKVAKTISPNDLMNGNYNSATLESAATPIKNLNQNIIS